jgi:hypothetical protein
MLEITVHGFHVGAPYDLAAAGALVSWGGEELVRFGALYRDGRVRSALGAELAILAAALDWARVHGGRGEHVTVRSGLGELASTCRSRGRAGDPEIRDLLERLEDVARDFDGLHALVSAGGVTAPALEAAVRAALGTSLPRSAP